MALMYGNPYNLDQHERHMFLYYILLKYKGFVKEIRMGYDSNGSILEIEAEAYFAIGSVIHLDIIFYLDSGHSITSYSVGHDATLIENYYGKGWKYEI